MKLVKKGKWILLASICVFISVIVSFIFVIENIKSIDSGVENRESYTIIEEDPYYSKTQYFYNVNDFMAAQNTKGNGVTVKKASIANASHIEEEFILGVIKTVVVAERYDDEGKAIDSRLLTYEEVEEIPDKQVKDIEYIGKDSEQKYSLQIQLLVTKDTYDGTYDVLGEAEWSSELVWGGEENPEDSADDFMGLTWGGNGELEAKDFNFGGFYRDDTRIVGERKISDKYGAYCWQFREKTGLWTSAMHRASAQVTLQKTYPEQKGKETNVRFTYIHSYGYVTPSISISAGYPSGVAGSIGFTTAGGAWQIEIDVGDILY